jgi:hypothetical protein
MGDRACIPKSRPAPAHIGVWGSKNTVWEFILFHVYPFWQERSQPSFRENYFSVPRLNGQKRYNPISLSGNTAASKKENKLKNLWQYCHPMK